MWVIKVLTSSLCRSWPVRCFTFASTCSFSLSLWSSSRLPFGCCSKCSHWPPSTSGCSEGKMSVCVCVTYSVTQVYHFLPKIKVIFKFAEKILIHLKLSLKVIMFVFWFIDTPHHMGALWNQRLRDRRNHQGCCPFSFLPSSLLCSVRDSTLIKVRHHHK